MMFHGVLWCSMMFYDVLWCFMMFYGVLCLRSILDFLLSERTSKFLHLFFKNYQSDYGWFWLRLLFSLASLFSMYNLFQYSIKPCSCAAFNCQLEITKKNPLGMRAIRKHTFQNYVPFEKWCVLDLIVPNWEATRRQL